MKELLIVDGYNVIHGWTPLKSRAQEDLEWAREELVAILEDYAGFCGTDVLLVFDAHLSAAAERSVETKGPLTIVYTRADETADQYIERFVQEQKDAQTGVQISVATSDGTEQSLVLGMGAARVPARELGQLIEAAKARRHGLADAVKARTPLESRVEKHVIDKLEAIRRGPVEE